MLGSLAGVISAILGFLYQQFRVNGQQNERLKAQETKKDPFWRMLHQKLPALLHSDDTPELDVLLEKMQCGQLNFDDSLHLKEMLEQKLQEEIKTKSPKVLTISLIIASVEGIIAEHTRKGKSPWHKFKLRLSL